jgi:hypothetical protein
VRNVCRNPNDGADRGRLGRAHHRLDVAWRHRAVFRIDKDEIESGRAADIDQPRRIEIDDRGDNLVPAGEAFTHTVLTNHDLFLLFCRFQETYAGTLQTQIFKIAIEPCLLPAAREYRRSIAP